MKSSRNDILYDRLKALCIGYSTGNFEQVIDCLSDDCVLESQWVLAPNVGKQIIADYYTAKGETMKKHNVLPECIIVELVGNFNRIENSKIHLNGGKAQKGTLRLWYENGKLAMLITQKSNGETVSTVVDIMLNEANEISRIDICMPELFNFNYYAGPFKS